MTTFDEQIVSRVFLIPLTCSVEQADLVHVHVSPQVLMPGYLQHRYVVSYFSSFS
jgi:hypothetical protein